MIIKSSGHSDIIMCMFQVNGSMKCSWVQQVSCKLDGPPLIVNFPRKLVLVSVTLGCTVASDIMLNNLISLIGYCVVAV
jgi:hypothetical protein